MMKIQIMSNEAASTLWDLVMKLSWIEDDPTIYASEPWDRNAKALLVSTDGEGCAAEPIPPGFVYFLETSICKEILEGIARHKLSSERRFEVILYYAQNDAFPEWLNRL
jgi:hypothetical protein